MRNSFDVIEERWAKRGRVRRLCGRETFRWFIGQWATKRCVKTGARNVPKFHDFFDSHYHLSERLSCSAVLCRHMHSPSPALVGRVNGPGLPAQASLACWGVRGPFHV